MLFTYCFTLAMPSFQLASATLELLTFFKLSRVKDLSRLIRTPMPRLKMLSIDSMRNYVPPDFKMFPNLKNLHVRNTNWPSLRWLSKLPTLEGPSIWGDKIADNDWRPLAKLPRLKELHGMHTVFRAADRKEFARLRPDVKMKWNGARFRLESGNRTTKLTKSKQCGQFR